MLGFFQLLKALPESFEFPGEIRSTHVLNAGRVGRLSELSCTMTSPVAKLHCGKQKSNVLPCFVWWHRRHHHLCHLCCSLCIQGHFDLQEVTVGEQEETMQR